MKMYLNTKKKRFLICVMICLILSTEFVDSSKAIKSVLKVAKKLKKAKKILPFLLLGPKVLVIKTG